MYFSRHEDRSNDDKRKTSIKERLGVTNGNRRSYPILGGRLHFVKFETSKISECLDFIYSKQLHRGGSGSFIFKILFSFLGAEHDICPRLLYHISGGGFIHVT